MQTVVPSKRPRPSRASAHVQQVRNFQHEVSRRAAPRQAQQSGSNDPDHIRQVPESRSGPAHSGGAQQPQQSSAVHHVDQQAAPPRSQTQSERNAAEEANWARAQPELLDQSLREWVTPDSKVTAAAKAVQLHLLQWLVLERASACKHCGASGDAFLVKRHVAVLHVSLPHQQLLQLPVRECNRCVLNAAYVHGVIIVQGIHVHMRHVRVMS